MSGMSSTCKPPPYHVTVHQVQEVSLFGSADLSYWRKALVDYALHPAQRNGTAELIVSATRARFMGKCFRELSFSVVVTEMEGTDRRDGVFMFHAYNSSSFFAWVERTFFHTPYVAGDLTVSAGESPFVLLRERREAVFHAQCGSKDLATPRIPERVDEVLWEVPIHLPSKNPAKGRHRLFWARICGATSFLTFDPQQDLWEVDRKPPHRGFDVLAACDFRPREWQIRPAATHSKAKTTYRDS